MAQPSSHRLAPTMKRMLALAIEPTIASETGVYSEPLPFANFGTLEVNGREINSRSTFPTASPAVTISASRIVKLKVRSLGAR